MVRDVLNRNESDILKGLLKLKPKEDHIYAVVKEPVFKTEDGYFGVYKKPFRDTSYSINCIKGESPLAYKLKKLLYLGMFENPTCFDKVFVFSDYVDGRGFSNELRFSGYVMLWEDSRYLSSWDKIPELSAEVFVNMDDRHKIEFGMFGFTKEEGFEICRELNGRWRNDLRYVDFAEQGIYIKKTLKSMLKQLDDFMTSECMVDPEEQIKKDLNG